MENDITNLRTQLNLAKEICLMTTIISTMNGSISGLRESIENSKRFADVEHQINVVEFMGNYFN